MRLVKSYSDRVLLETRVVGVSYRMGSTETFEESWTAKASRIYSNGWSIAVVVGAGDNRVLLRARGGWGLAEATLYSGKQVMGVEEVGFEDLSKLFTKAIAAAEAEGCEVEATISYTIEHIRIEHPEGVAELVKGYTDLNATLVYASATASLRLSSPGFPRSQLRLAGSILREKCLEARHASRARHISPLSYGKWSIILYGDAAGAFLHEVAHGLEALRPVFRVGERLRPQTSLKLYDDPYNPLSPAWRPFDDEAVTARRRTLIEDGAVVDLLHTRETAAKHNTTPGNAWGLLHRPVPGHTTLVLEAGDWKDTEMVEETRRGILVDQIVMAHISEGVVTLVPETAWLIEDGEVKQPVKMTRLRIPVKRGLETIDAISRTPRLRVSTEKGRLRAELAPAIRLIGYID